MNGSRMRRLGAIVGVGTLALALTACGGGGDVKIGETAKVELPGVGGAIFPFDVTVTSLTEAPADVQDEIEGDETVYYADVEVTHVGDAESELPYTIFDNVYAKLDDGSYLEVSFFGFEGDCDSGNAAENHAALDAGETVAFCVPLSGDGENDLVGVYVGPSDINDDGGRVWTR